MGGQVSLTARETEKDKEARFEYSIFNNSGLGQQLSPLNMPFGHSYVLPVILAVLTAPAGSLILVENPESHLHPGAQLPDGRIPLACRRIRYTDYHRNPQRSSDERYPHSLPERNYWLQPGGNGLDRT